MAKAVNCLIPQDGDPCDSCAPCVSANEGRMMDIIELDAASNRGIDEIRDIRDKVNFAPVAGSRKIYIIDEAHMLTDQASNAFLKTLEEPPGHVIFILCTTEAQKILPTIVSRCQRHDFRRLPGEVVYGRLNEIAEAEGVTADPEALRAVARYSAGSLRDAENLLEQLVLSSDGNVNLGQVEELLGLGRGDRWLELARSLLTGNTPPPWKRLTRRLGDGADLRQLHRQTLELLRAAMLLEWGARERLDLPDPPVGTTARTGQPAPVLAGHPGRENLGRRQPALRCPVHPAAGTGVGGDLHPGSPAPRQPAPAAPSRESSPGRGSPANAPGGRADLPRRHRVVRPGFCSAAWTRRPGRTRRAGYGRRYALPLAGDGQGPGPLQGTGVQSGALLRDCLSDNVTIEGETLVLPFRNGSNLERMQREMEDPNNRRWLPKLWRSSSVHPTNCG